MSHSDIEIRDRADAYDAFVSYSHAADDLLAPRLQTGLQRFAKPWWKRRALHIFRDESSLSASPHLSRDSGICQNWGQSAQRSTRVPERHRSSPSTSHRSPGCLGSRPRCPSPRTSA